jgi:hypothetical protein
MEMDTQSRMRARIAALSKRISHVDCQDACEFERDPAGRRHVEGGTPSSSPAGHPPIHPEMTLAGKSAATDKSGITLNRKFIPSKLSAHRPASWSGAEPILYFTPRTEHFGSWTSAASNA